MVSCMKVIFRNGSYIMKLFQMFFFLFIDQTFVQSWCDTTGCYTLAYVQLLICLLWKLQCSWSCKNTFLYKSIHNHPRGGGGAPVKRFFVLFFFLRSYEGLRQVYIRILMCMYRYVYPLLKRWVSYYQI